MKTCRVCKIEKEDTEFYHVKKGEPKLRDNCKKCDSAISMAYFRSEKGKERKRIADAKWSQSDEGKANRKKFLETYVVPEASKQKRREHQRTEAAKALTKARVRRYLDNGGKAVNRKYAQREEVRERLRAYRQTEQYQEMKRRYWDSPEGKAMRARNDHKKRLREISLPNTLTAEEWVQIKKQFKHRCIYCGEKKPLTHEHIIPLSRGGGFTKDNILPACKECNSRRGNRKMLLELLAEPCYPKVACFCVAM